jgi:hypothetical protein
MHVTRIRNMHISRNLNVHVMRNECFREFLKAKKPTPGTPYKGW